MKKSIIIYLLFYIFFVSGCNNNKTIKEIKSSLNEEEIIKLAEEALSAKDLKIKKDKTYVIESDNEHVLFLKNGEYTYVDLRGENAKVYTLATKKFIEVKIVEILKDGYVVEHDGHLDFIKGNLPSDKKVGDFIKIEDTHSHTHGNKEEKIKTEDKSLNVEKKLGETDDGFKFSKKDIVKETENGYVVKHGDHLHFVYKSSSNAKNISTKLISNNNDKHNHEDNYVFNRNDIVSEDDEGYVVRHGDHYHYIYKKDVDKPKTSSSNKVNNQSTNSKDNNKKVNTEKKYDEETLRKIEYIAKYHQIDKNLIKIQGEFLVYPHEDHYHSIPLKDIIIPNISNDPEKDFEEELEALAKRMHVEKSSIIIEDGYMKINHGNHVHSFKILSPGWKEYLKNRIPQINGDYVEGPLDRNDVLSLANKLKDKAKLLSDKKQSRRILSALDDFIKDLAWGDNSTKGYKKILEDFDKKYISKDNIQKEENIPSYNLDYKDVLKKIASAKQNLSKNSEDYSNKLAKLNQLETDASYKFKTADEINYELEKLNIQNSNTTEKLSEFEILYNKIYQSIKALDEDKYLSHKISLLNKLDEIKKIESNINELKKLELELNSIKSSTTNIQNKIDELLNYINLNKDDARLSDDIKSKINEEINEVNNSSLSQNEKITKLQELKSIIKTSFKDFEQMENRYSRMATNMLVECETIINKIEDENIKNEKINELNNLKEEINSSSNKKIIYNKIISFKESLSTISSNLNNSNQDINETQEHIENQQKDDLPQEENYEQEINELISFINNNKRNIDDNFSQKVKLINDFYTLEEQFNSKTRNNLEIVQELRTIKENILPHIIENNESNSNDGW